MTLRFVPQCRRKFQAIREGQRCLGQANDGALLHKTRQTAHALSILITWSLEDAADTASSMKSRGYGLPGRSSFSIYRFENRDLAVLAWMIGCGALVLGFGLSGALAWRYYPTVKGAPLTASQLLALLCHAFLCLTPVYLSAREGLRWKHLSSGM
jgi:energy-coupling factor transport system permease protein